MGDYDHGGSFVGKLSHNIQNLAYLRLKNLTVGYTVPQKLTREQKRRIEELDESTDVKQCEKMKRYKDNIQAMYGKDPYRS